MKKLSVVSVVGARPNFMKVAPIQRALSKSGDFEARLVHTGQHYDPAMSRVFFEELALPEPHVYLGVGSGTHAEQTARVMIDFARVCDEWKPDLVLVVGDVNSTLACALVASKIPIPVAHVEAGLRSGDRSMPEEINRLVTDALSDLLFTSCEDAAAHLVREGIDCRKICFVGNVMIDSLVAHLDRSAETYRNRFAGEFSQHSYALVTLHRPSNVDDPRRLAEIARLLERLSDRLPVVFPVHPRTAARLAADGIVPGGRVTLIDPVGYLEFLGLMQHARLVVTDSGGVQEETSFLDVPCVTVRDNTERPVTITLGSNVLAGTDAGRVFDACVQQLETPRRARPIPLWDGHAADRIVSALEARCDLRYASL